MKTSGNTDEQGDIWVESRQLDKGGNMGIIERNTALFKYCGQLLINSVDNTAGGNLQHFISISNVHQVT